MHQVIDPRVKAATRILVRENGTDRAYLQGVTVCSIEGYSQPEIERALALWREWKRKMKRVKDEEE